MIAFIEDQRIVCDVVFDLQGVADCAVNILPPSGMPH
jgi:hypothetical protein